MQQDILTVATRVPLHDLDRPFTRFVVHGPIHDHEVRDTVLVCAAAGLRHALAGQDWTFVAAVLTALETFTGPDDVDIGLGLDGDDVLALFLVPRTAKINSG